MGLELRRTDRGMTEAEARELLERGEYGVLSTADAEGRPYGLPLSYCVLENAVYIHCALEGHKVRNMAANSRVSFCVVGATELLPSQFATRYESVIVTGRADEVFAEEKQRALEGLVAKYSPQFLDEGSRYIAAMGDRTRTFRISIDSISGKARR
ncbi:pyridoxamine 5'-phosphate oxidase family protein [Trichlorobacter ammonificans]|uniref:MFS transporter n=1 Tax=Trichlorobacter ammonificans TaxID=2916410 RepID=A0ABM9DCF3_9BACT|nr:pyridoxamine 5'-phosphate oxidase family protein [Trichlorobacter ammonificans]CAH2032546.1 MFS transporter [Trichlorobacter ammonificans]